MADGTTGDNYEDNYNFSDTSALAICGALTGPVVEDLKICVGQTADLAAVSYTHLDVYKRQEYYCASFRSWWK